MLTFGERLWRCTPSALLLVGLLSVESQLAAAEALPQGVTRSAAPRWVEPIELGADIKSDSGALGSQVDYLLFDQQIRVAKGDHVEYRHIALRAQNSQGLDQVANLQIDFDPGFHKLTLHRLQVRRAGKLIPQFGSAQIRLLQRELGLENLIIEGTRTLHIVLSDVRVGDLIEYSYSRRGLNPALQGRVTGHFMLQNSVPIQRLRARLLWPSGRALHWRHHNQPPKGKVTQNAGEEDYRWDLASVPARRIEPDAPAWWNPYPWVQWGEHGDWHSVASWAAPLYDLQPSPDPEVQKVIDRIQAEHADPEQRAIAAIRWVQAEIRYLAVALGSSSLVPSAPGAVIKRRYGDCKDKTLLGLSLLRGLGIEARAALVNTRLVRSIDQYLPGPGVFNHVVIRAQVGGRTYWLDPTRLPQAGQRLSDWVQAGFQRGLVVDRATTALEAIPESQGVKRRFHVLIDSSAGLERPAQFTVTSEFAGESAETVRAAVAARGRDDLQKNYLNFYARSYPSLAIQAPIEVADDLVANRLRTVEHYTLQGLWHWSATKQQHETTIGSPDLEEQLRTPSSITRDSPLDLRHPHTVEAITEVRLPVDWRVSGNGFEIRDDAFEVTRTESLAGRTITWTDRYRSLKDHVPAAEVGRYAANLDRARQGLNITLSKSSRSSLGGPHWMPLSVALLSVFGLAWLARRLYRWDPDPKPFSPQPAYNVPVGIGGWLLIPLLGLVIQAFQVVHALYESWPTFEPEVWKAFADPSAAGYHPIVAPLLLLSLAGLLASLTLTGLNLLLALQQRSSFPRLYIAAGILGIALLGVDQVTFAFLPEADRVDLPKQIANSVRGTIVTLIWITYMVKSRRVQATFVKRLPNRTVSPPVGASPGIE